MRRELEVPLEVRNDIDMHRCRNVSHLVLELGCRKGNNEYDML